ncbi:RNA-directed DNA polymerase from mobile element jockey [Caerostris darwini]|uniref:RNA-directed DNA polymerase from mobile element jockey n=1 Tax=Caerostris darwini TaxID=1538125 RepID=A0AAV4URJ8_9ARAC|nr:RNA-directed DNA polymerase from mobile element jockey [Caerostris darwini]
MLPQSGPKKSVQIIQNKLLRIITGAPWFVRNSTIHHDLKIDSIDNYITKLSRNFFNTIATDENPLIKAQTIFTQLNGKYKYPFSTSKWNRSLKPP